MFRNRDVPSGAGIWRRTHDRRPPVDREVVAVLRLLRAQLPWWLAGRPDPLQMEVISAFIALKQGHQPSEELRQELAGTVRQELGRSRSSAKSTSSPACPEPAAARSCGGC